MKVYLYQPSGNIKDVYCFAGRGNLNILKSKEIDAVIYMKEDYRVKVSQQSWYDPARFRGYSATKKQHFFSIKKLRWTSFDYGCGYDLVLKSKIKPS